MNSQKRAAFFGRSLDLIFVKRKNFFLIPIVRKGAEEERIIREELGFSETIEIEDENFLEMGNLEVIKKTNLFDTLKKRKIKTFFTTSPFSKRGIEIFPQYSKGAQKLENKIFFERFLRKYHLSKDSRIFLKFPKNLPFKETVIQLPCSTGAEKTFLVKSREEFKKIKKKISPPFLARRFFRGIPCGVTILIGKKTYFSAIDRQCFEKAQDERIGIFRGIQWLPFDFFPRKIYRKIEEKLKRISNALKKEGFFGWINLDFIVDKQGQVFFLEANPRFTLATPQILAFLELTGGVDFFELITNKEKKFHNCEKLPLSRYEGAAIYLKKQKGEKIQEIKKGGFFKVVGEKIKKIKLSDRMKFLELKKGFFFYNELKRGDFLKKDIESGTIISNFPLFEFETGKLSKIGKEIKRTFESK